MEMIVLGSAVLQETSGPEQGVIQRFGGAMTFPEISISQPVPGMSPLMICLGSLENRESLFFYLLKIQLLWELSCAFRDQAGGWTCLVQVLGIYS